MSYRLGMTLWKRFALRGTTLRHLLGSLHAATVRRVRVLLLTSSSARRGAEQQAARVAALLHGAGVVVIRRALSPGLGDNLDRSVAVLGRWPLGPLTMVRLRRLARQVDVTVAYGASTLPACAIAFGMSRHRFVYRSIGDPRDWVRGPLHRRRTAVLFRRACAIVAQSAEVGRGIAECFGVAPSRLAVIPNLPPSTSFRPGNEQEIAEARAALGLRAGSDVVAFVGALAPEKRVDLILRAASKLHDVDVLIVGDGTELPYLRRLAESLGVRAVFSGAIADTRAAYWASDVLVLASSTEGQPSVVLEAAMSAVPVVACDVGSVSHFFSLGVAGVLVGRDLTHEMLASAIRTALSGPKGEPTRLRESLSEDEPIAAWKALLRRVAQ